jgi:hypothetical protein
MKKIILLLISLLFLTGCVIATPQSRQAYVNMNPGLPYQTKTDILNGLVRIGMRPSHVKASWGEPTHYPRRTITSQGVIETWRYGPREVVFYDGKVGAIYE